MISDNKIHPKTYGVSKVTELVPAGVVKLTMKQKPFDEKRDNIQLQICDYYDLNGDVLVNSPTPILPTPTNPNVGTSVIKWMYKTDDGELDYASNSAIPIYEVLKLRQTSYFFADFSDDYSGDYIWTLKLKDIADNYTDKQEEQLIDYIKIIDHQDGVCSLKPNRIKDLIGNIFILSVSDEQGGHYSSIELEVTA